jgi:hypothetical protein
LRISFHKVLAGPDLPLSDYKSGKLLVQLTPLNIK